LYTLCLSLLVRRAQLPTLLPYTTLFRSPGSQSGGAAAVHRRGLRELGPRAQGAGARGPGACLGVTPALRLHVPPGGRRRAAGLGDRKSTRLNSSHVEIPYAVFCLKKKKA